jgi:hypothetical protein
MAIWLVRGTLRDLPARLETRLAEVFSRPVEQIRGILQSGPSTFQPAPAHFKSSGVPQPARRRVRTFREALEESDLTEEQRQEWLSGEG